MKPDPTEPRHAVSDDKHGVPPRQSPETLLQNEYTGEAERDGIPANGTAPAEPRGPEDVGA